jgi:hypothetical protein
VFARERPPPTARAASRQLRLAIVKTSDVAARLRKAFDVTARERVVIIRQHDDRHRGSRCSRRLQRNFRAVRDEHVRLRGDHLVGSGERLRHPLVRAAIFQDKILAFGDSELAQFGEEDLVTWPRNRIVEIRAQHADTGDPARLLRARRERPRASRAAEQGDELAPSYVEHGASSPLRAGGASNDHQPAEGHCSRLLHGKTTMEGGQKSLGRPELF